MNNLTLFHKFTFINHALMRRNANEKNITRGQGRIIAILNHKDGISTRDMSELLNIKVTSLNETLNKLQEKGYVEKRPSEKDKRVLLIYLTGKGRELKLKDPKDSDIFDCLSDRQKRELEISLDLIIGELHDRMKNENPEKYENMMKCRSELMKKHFKSNPEWFKQY